MSSQSSDSRMIPVRAVPIGTVLVIPKVNVLTEVAPTLDHVLRYQDRFKNYCLEHLDFKTFKFLHILSIVSFLF